MWIFPLLRLFLVVQVHLYRALVSAGGSCHFHQKNIYVNNGFLTKVSDCTDWIGRGDSIIWINNRLTQEQTNNALEKVETISDVATIFIRTGANIKNLEFPKLTKVNGKLKAFYISRCPSLETVSFLALKSLDVGHVFMREVKMMNVSSMNAIFKIISGNPPVSFDEGCHVYNKKITNTSLARSHCRFVHDLRFVKDITGKVKASLVYVRRTLNIVQTRLHDLDFLTLEPLEDKLNKTCVIANNKFCKYDEIGLRAMIDKVYINCTIQNNIGGYCECSSGKGICCELAVKEHVVDRVFVETYSSCNEWTTEDGVSRIVFNGDVSQDMMDTLLENLQRIHGVELVISENEQLKSVNFPELDSAKDLSFTANFSFTPNVAKIEFKKVNSGTKNVKIVTYGLNSLTEDCVNDLMEKFPGSEITFGECAFKQPIADESLLTNCRSILNSLAFASKKFGVINTKIESIEQDLIIEGVVMPDLSFLQFIKRENKNRNTCKIVNNKICDYNALELKEMVGRVYENCSIEQYQQYCVCPSGKGRCCEFSAKEHVVDSVFVKTYSTCNEWTNKDGVSRIVVNGNVSQDMMDTLLENLRRIHGVELVISENEQLTSVNFPAMDSAKDLSFTATFSLSPNIAEVNFQEVESNTKNVKIVTRGLNSLTEESVSKLKEQFPGSEITFGECAFKQPIADESLLSNCRSIVRSLEFASQKFGAINTKIESIEQDLIIEGAILPDLSFLQFSNKDQKNRNTCKIIKNKICNYNAVELKEMVGRVYENCTIEQNQQYCECELKDQRYEVNETFVAKYSGCHYWYSTNSSMKSRIVLSGFVSQTMFDRLFQTVRNISGAILEITNNAQLTRLVFPSLESLGEGDQAAIVNFTYLPKLKKVSFPSLPDSPPSDINITTYGVPLLRKPSIIALKKKFTNNSMSPLGECAFRHPISDMSLLEKCERVASLVIAPKTIGKSKAVIKYVRKELILNRTFLHNLEFLNLTRLNKKNNHTCLIARNCLCNYEMEKLREMLLGHYENCTIGVNAWGRCDRYRIPPPYEPYVQRRPGLIDNRGYYVPPPDAGWWRMPAFFTASIIFLSFLCCVCPQHNYS